VWRRRELPGRGRASADTGVFPGSSRNAPRSCPSVRARYADSSSWSPFPCNQGVDARKSVEGAERQRGGASRHVVSRGLMRMSAAPKAVCRSENHQIVWTARPAPHSMTVNLAHRAGARRAKFAACLLVVRSVRTPTCRHRTSGRSAARAGRRRAPRQRLDCAERLPVHGNFTLLCWPYLAPTDLRALPVVDRTMALCNMFRGKPSPLELPVYVARVAKHPPASPCPSVAAHRTPRAGRCRDKDQDNGRRTPTLRQHLPQKIVAARSVRSGRRVCEPRRVRAPEAFRPR
jgi:hypothetical protein